MDRSHSQHGQEPQFHTTQWSQLLDSHGVSSDEGPCALTHRALAHLCQTYWFPLYAFARSKGHQYADAEDLTQSFLATMIEKGRFNAIHPSHGRLRSFLLASFENHLRDARNRQRAAKRGGGVHPLPWVDGSTAEARYSEQLGARRSPEEAFDLHWALETLNHTLEGLRQEYAARGKTALFDALHPFLTGQAEHGDLAAAADTLGLEASSLRSAATRLRQRYRARLKDLVAQTVAHPSAAEDEFAEICAILRKA